jgi:AAA+ ATPase superfamily predicted ATPase
MGTVFEKVCKQFLLLNRDRLPFTFTKLGRWWHKDKEIDVVALNEESKEHFGLIAKQIEGKERLKKEGYFVFDFDDFWA